KILLLIIRNIVPSKEQFTLDMVIMHQLAAYSKLAKDKTSTECRRENLVLFDKLSKNKVLAISLTS
ncbi:hypothetical protein DU978_25250, partial [Vibrio parahaemolyticus]|nr:hypothetical protein [Vibrio parahaemolyticus]